MKGAAHADRGTPIASLELLAKGVTKAGGHEVGANKLQMQQVANTLSEPEGRPGSWMNCNLLQQGQRRQQTVAMEQSATMDYTTPELGA